MISTVVKLRGEVIISEDTQMITKKIHRITESQNVKGWEGPLWVI